MSFREIIWPTRWKVSLALLIGAVSVALIYLSSTYYMNALFSLDLHLRVASVFLSFAIVTLIYYPLSCGVVFLYGSCRKRPDPKPARKGEKGKKAERPVKAAKVPRRDKIIAVLLILIFNPFTFSLFYAAGTYVNVSLLSYPCGVAVLGFSADSPAEQAGMGTGEVIVIVDGQNITTTDSLTSALAGKSPGEVVSVWTSKKEYGIELGQNSQNRTVIGVITQTAYCSRW